MKTCFYILGALFIGSSIAAHASPQTLEPNKRELVTGQGYQPYTDSSLKEGGLFTKLVKEAYRKVGIRAQTHFLSFHRSYMETKRGDWTATFPWVKNAEREKDFYFSDPVTYFKVKLFVLNKNIAQYQGIDSLKGKVLCAPDGYTVLEPMGTLLKQKKIRYERPLDNESCFRMLLSGRCDIVEANEVVGLTLVRKLYGDKPVVSVIPGVSPKYPLYVIFPKSRSGALKERETFNRGLRELVQSGEKDKLELSYLREVSG